MEGSEKGPYSRNEALLHKEATFPVQNLLYEGSVWCRLRGEQALHLGQLREGEYLVGDHSAFLPLTAFSINLTRNFAKNKQHADSKKQKAN